MGKAVGLPLWRLRGGYRREVPLMAIGGYYGEPLGPIAEEIAFYKRAGLAGVKFKVGGAAPAVDAERGAAARDAAGPDFIIAVDANQGYAPKDALEFAWRADGLGIRWFEEPQVSAHLLASQPHGTYAGTGGGDVRGAACRRLPRCRMAKERIRCVARPRTAASRSACR